MAQKQPSAAEIRAARSARRNARLAAMPPAPAQGGAYRLDGTGKLVRESVETAAKEAR